MKKLNRQILVGVFLTIVLMTSTAQAGLVDWFTSNKAQGEQASNGSFDQIYASVTATDTPNAKAMAILMSSNAMVALATPSKPHGSIKVTQRTYWVQVSGYNSEVGQCDDSPFITASGTHVHWGTIAANIIDANGHNIPFGTLVKIPAVFGDQIFVVEDRLNKRYTNNVDVWFEKHADALKLGRRNVQIEIIK